MADYAPRGAFGVLLTPFDEGGRVKSLSRQNYFKVSY